MQVQAVGWLYPRLNIASLLSMKIVGCSWKGFLVKMFWLVLLQTSFSTVLYGTDVFISRV